MNEEQFISLIKEHQGVIYKILYLYTDDPEDKKDLYQEIVLQAWKSTKSFRGDASFSTWLYKISLNTSLTFLKKSRKQKTTYTQINQEIDRKVEHSEPNDRSEWLASEIRKLNDIDKSLITLHLDDYSNDEIADIMGMSKNNVAVKIHRIKEVIKSKMK